MFEQMAGFDHLSLVARCYRLDRLHSLGQPESGNSVLQISLVSLIPRSLP